MVAWGPQILCRAFWRPLLFKMLKNSFDFFSEFSMSFFVENSISSKKILLFLWLQFPIVLLYVHIWSYLQILFSNAKKWCQQGLWGCELSWTYPKKRTTKNLFTLYFIGLWFMHTIHHYVFCRRYPIEKTFFVNRVPICFLGKCQNLLKENNYNTLK